MLKTAARLVLSCALLTALPASAQTPPASTAGAAEALAWRAFQACLLISKGGSLDTAAPAAGFLKDDKGWAAEIAERTLTIELATPPAPPGAKSCVVVARGALADHDGFGKRIGGWAGKEGFTGPDAGTTAGGGQTLRFVTPDGARAVVLVHYPDTGNPDQPTRSILFVGWTQP